jgi:hypothetical protein
MGWEKGTLTGCKHARRTLLFCCAALCCFVSLRFHPGDVKTPEKAPSQFALILEMDGDTKRENS